MGAEPRRRAEAEGEGEGTPVRDAWVLSKESQAEFQGEMAVGYTRRSSSGAVGEKAGAGPRLQRGKKGAARALSRGAGKGGATTVDRSWNASSRLKKRKGEKERSNPADMEVTRPDLLWRVGT